MKKKRSAAKAKPKKRAKAKPKKSAKAKVRAKATPKAKKTAGRKSPAKTKAKARAGKPPPSVIAPPNSVELGRVEDYFAKIGVIALTLLHELSVGDHIHVLGHTTNLEQTVDSMEIDHQPTNHASEKDAVGIKITARARRGDHVYLIRM